MYGDIETVHRQARRLRDQAVDVRLLADRLVAQTEALGWTGRAAASMHERIQERASHLRQAATGHDTAADSLDKHAADAGVVRDQITDLERKATSLVADARTRIARLEADGADGAHDRETGVRRRPDPDDEVLAAFVPPPSGHLDWLAVELPGL